jgi:hypothetical protein
MYKGKTSFGFEFEIPETALDNMELIEIMSEVEDNPLLFTKVVNLLLGKEQKKALYDHLRREDGTVPIKAVSEAVTEIFNLLGEIGKNS